MLRVEVRKGKIFKKLGQSNFPAKSVYLKYMFNSKRRCSRISRFKYVGNEMYEKYDFLDKENLNEKNGKFLYCIFSVLLL